MSKLLYTVTFTLEQDVDFSNFRDFVCSYFDVQDITVSPMFEEDSDKQHE